MTANVKRPSKAPPSREIAVWVDNSGLEFDEDIMLMRISLARLFRRAIERDMAQGRGPVALTEERNGMPDVAAAVAEELGAEELARVVAELNLAKEHQTDVDRELAELAPWRETIDGGVVAEVLRTG